MIQGHYIRVWVGSLVCPVHNLRELAGSEALPRGLELVLIFRESQEGAPGPGALRAGCSDPLELPWGSVVPLDSECGAAGAGEARGPGVPCCMRPPEL